MRAQLLTPILDDLETQQEQSAEAWPLLDTLEAALCAVVVVAALPRVQEHTYYLQGMLPLREQPRRILLSPQPPSACKEAERSISQ
jgi:hypothetical protein